MDLESWSNTDVLNLMQNYVPLKIDITYQEEFAKRYSVLSIPYIFIVDANGEVVFKNNDYMSTSKVKEVLKKYNTNTNFFNHELVSFYEHQNYSTSVRLALKYLDYSLFLKEKAVKDDILSLSRSYSKIAEGSLDKKNEKFSTLKQKTELLDLNIDLYKGKDNLVIKRLEKKFDESEIAPINKSLYCFINYLAFEKIANHEKSALWLAKLNKEHGSESLLVKAEQYLKTK